MGILETIRLALAAFLEISKDFKLILAAIQRKNELDSLALRGQFLQAAQSAMTEDEYKKAARALHEAVKSI